LVDGTKGRGGIRFGYVGLKRPSGDEPKNLPPKSLDELTSEFVESVGNCRLGIKAERWKKALETLEADPLFQEAEVSALLESREREWRQDAETLFSRLSAGHKIVLLTTTRLVELVDEASLVLLDEPEAHLHPPLLSAFVRALSDLLVQRNGVAIVATHSPVVLQEAPKSCVWLLRRVGGFSRAERPSIETFGENVGVLTREVFGLEVTRSGFHRLLEDEIMNRGVTYTELLRRFDEQLGAEGRAIARAMIAARDQKIA
jgi:hypothetical protein